MSDIVYELELHLLLDLPSIESSRYTPHTNQEPKASNKILVEYYTTW